MDKTKKIKLTKLKKKEKKIVAKLKKSNCDKTKKKFFLTKLKRSNCDQTQKLKL